MPKALTTKAGALLAERARRSDVMREMRHAAIAKAEGGAA